MKLEDGVLVVDGRGLKRLDARGAVLWVNLELASAGVELGPIVGDAVLGRGRWGDSWQSFAVSLATGEKIVWNGP